LHHDLFSPEVEDPLESRDNDDEDEPVTKFTLKTIEYLAGASSKIGGVIVLGMLTQLKEGKYYLEDPTGSVELDLSGTTFQNGLFAENCFVLAEGYWEDQIFYVTAMGLPPPEDAETSRNFYGSTNFFGGPPSNMKRERLALIERENDDSLFVILSDVHLDKVQVLEKLRVLFAGYAEGRPLLFIFMGNFLSEPHGTQNSVALRDALKTLADVILEFPTLAEGSRFVFVPGPQDPGFVNILPRPAFAEVITEYVRTKIPHAIFATNPCRIRYCTKEIIVAREDIVTKFSRNAIRFPEDGSIAEHFVSTIVAQGHLCPLPLHICPVYWPFDHALYVDPLPNLVIIGDKSNSFNITRSGCTFTNPGPFVKTNFSFQTYTPYINNIDDCQLPSET
jgi:DNA polymerase epsilon subunit 2